MTDYEAISIAEGFEPARGEVHAVQAWQHLIDTGLAWRLQGWFGRQAWALLESGVCQMPRKTSKHVV